MSFLDSYPFFSKNAIREFYNNTEGAIRKSWGQNFLINPGIVDKLVSNLGAPKDALVLEIGCGLGALTRHLLLNNYKVIGLEIDPISAKLLQENFPQQNNNPLILKLDAIKFMDHILKEKTYSISTDSTLSTLTKDIELKAKDFHYICGNLPYYISSSLLQKIANFPKIKKGCFLLQKEYVNKISSPGSLSSLSVYLKNFGKWKSAGTVKPENFYPKPSIHSSVLVFEAHPKGPSAPPHLLEKLLRMSFAARRKKIQNSWKQDKRGYIEYEELLDKSKEAGINPQLRAEEIPEDSYYRLANLL